MNARLPRPLCACSPSAAGMLPRASDALPATLLAGLLVAGLLTAGCARVPSLGSAPGPPAGVAAEPVSASLLPSGPLSQAAQMWSENAAEVVAQAAGMGPLVPHSQPSHDRLWRVEQSVLPYAEVGPTAATIHNLRQTRWESEEVKQVRHADWCVPWEEIEGVDFVVVPFQDAPLLAHTMLAFRIRDGRCLVASVEARLEQGEVYSPLAGAAHQYELMVVLGDEPDLYGLRADVRGDDIYLYRSRATAEQSAELLRGVLDRVNAISAAPEFYDSLTNNCTTNIVDQVRRLRAPETTASWRDQLPTQSDRMAYDMGLIEGDRPFEQLRREAWISGKVRQFLGSEDFSRRIRGGGA